MAGVNVGVVLVYRYEDPFTQRPKHTASHSICNKMVTNINVLTIKILCPILL